MNKILAPHPDWTLAKLYTHQIPVAAPGHIYAIPVYFAEREVGEEIKKKQSTLKEEPEVMHVWHHLQEGTYYHLKTHKSIPIVE